MKLFSVFSTVEELHHLENNTLYLGDVFDLHQINEYTAYSRPKYIVTDHWGHMEHPGFDIHCLPVYAAQVAEVTKPIPPDDYQTRYTFNFLLNKKQVNRFMCLKLVEFFKLKNYNYTHSGFNTQFDMSEIIRELDFLGNQAPLKDWDRSFVLAPSEIPVKYFEMAGVDPLKVDEGIRFTSHSGPDRYFDYIKFIIKNSAISLITESNWGQRGSTFTEKTIYPFLGLTMPIWIGGWQQATAWKHMGFDIFDDVINHDYQNYKTQIERFYYAFCNNLELLTDFEKTAQLREQLMPRLIRNQELLLNGQLIHYIKNEISKWPADLQSILPEVFKKYPLVNRHFNG
jgi:hypothetical protein